MQSNERRQYLRSSHFHCIAKLKTELNGWKDVHVYDISSGGMKLRTTDEHGIGDVFWFDLNIQGFMSEFTVMVQGVVRHKDTSAAYYLYGIEFLGLSQELQVRIDENVRSDRPIEGDVYFPN